MAKKKAGSGKAAAAAAKKNTHNNNNGGGPKEQKEATTNTAGMSLRKMKIKQLHADPLASLNVGADGAGPEGLVASETTQHQQENGGSATTEGKKNRNKKKKGDAGASNNGGAPPTAPQPLLINGLEVTEQILKSLPKRKKGETKKQWQKRVGLEEPDMDEDGNFIARPPQNSNRLDVNPNDYEEEQAEDAGSETNDDFSDVANERQREYKKGGYHPVVVNELYHERYRVVHKLGWGYFSTVWLVWDYEKLVFQAMKVQKSAQHYTEAAFDEIKLLDQIMKGDPDSKFCCARMTNSFEHKGPHGTHVCMLFDLLGENLLSLGERYENRGIPLPIVKSIAREMLIGLHHIHSLGIIHTDIKPENVLLSSPKHKIHSLMAKYKPPPLGERPALLEKDPKMMTKSQRRRYYAKKKAAAEKGEDETTTTAAAAAASVEDPSVEGDKKETASKKAEKSKADGAESDATVSDIGADDDDDIRTKKEDNADGANSETDQEWEVERFHHVSLADFGNSCWIDLQFTDEVQTRQYRAPEVIIGDPYSCPIDMWSAAAMFFELLTGEFLFDPKSNNDYPRDEDHLALISELMGDLPDNMSMGRGKFRGQFYNSQGRLRHINELRYWGLKDVLHDKYRYSRKKAHEIASFLEPMLELDPTARATAEEMLTHFEQWFEVQEDDYSPLCFQGEHEEEDEEEAGAFNDSMLEPRAEDDNDDDDDYTDEEEEEEEADADAEGDESTGDAKKSKKKAGGARRRTTRKEQRQAEDDLAWFQQHECLQEDTLAAVGLTIEDIKEVLDVGKLKNPQKDEAAQKVLQQLLATNEE